MPICDKCKKEYESGACPSCDISGAELLKSSIPWPYFENGESVPPMRIMTVDSGLSGEILVKKLETCNIPVVKRYPLGGMMMNVLFGFTGAGVDLFVPETMAEEALAILEDVSDDEAEFTDDELNSAIDEYEAEKGNG